MNPRKLVYIILTYTPLSNLFHHYYPITIFGFSFWNTFIVLLAIHVLFLNSKPSKNDILSLTLFTAIYLVISIVRNLTIETTFTHSFGSFWYLYLVLIFLICIKKLKLSSKIILNICLGITLFYGIIGTLYFFNLPTIEIQSEFNKTFLSDVIHRYEGIAGASNVHSVYLITFFLIYTKLSKNKFVLWFLFPIVLFSIIASASRLPLLIYMLFWSNYLFKRSRLLFICMVSILSYNFIKIISSVNFAIRLFDVGVVDDSRIGKTNFFIDLISSNFLEILTFGIAPFQLSAGTLSISDNSFSLIILNSGFIIFIIWILIIKSIQPLFFKSLFSDKIFLISIFLIFSLNNAILFLPWVLFVITYCHILSSKTIINER